MVVADADRRGRFGAAAPPVAPVRVPRAVLRDAAAELYRPFWEAPAALQSQMRRHLPRETNETKTARKKGV